MPLEFCEDEILLSGVSVAEEALTLSEWLATHATAKVNLAGCTHLHTSLLQTLLAYKPTISAQPTDEFLTRWIIPILTGHDSDDGGISKRAISQGAISQDAISI